MFKARLADSPQFVLSLNPSLTTPALRALALVCPHCESAVGVRDGDRRRRHFFHRRRADCPLGHEDPLIVEARAVLYEWLCAKLETADLVQLEVMSDQGILLDLCLTGTHPNAIRLIGKQLRPAQRHLALRVDDKKLWVAPSS